MSDDQNARDQLHNAIQVVLDLHGPDEWTTQERQQVLDFLTDIAAAALSAEAEDGWAELE